jgi:ParB-like chromosome segregation protein Spo0J
MLKKVQLDRIDPNPYRRYGEYPILRDKVETIKESIETTSYWPNIIVRRTPDGRYQQAFGHHRLQALRELRKPTEEIEVIVRDLSNEMMFRMMSRENARQFKSSPWMEVECIRSALDAHDRGEITLDVKCGGARGPARKAGASRDSRRRREARERRRRQLRGEPRKLSDLARPIAQLLGMTRPDGRRKERRVSDNFEVAWKAIDLINRGLLTLDQVRLMRRFVFEKTVKGQLAIEESHREAAMESREQADRARAAAEALPTGTSPAVRAAAETAAANTEKRAARDEAAVVDKPRQFVAAVLAREAAGQGLRMADIDEMTERLRSRALIEEKLKQVDDIAIEIARQITKFTGDNSVLVQKLDLIQPLGHDLSPGVRAALLKARDAHLERIRDLFLWVEKVAAPQDMPTANAREMRAIGSPNGK